MEALLALLIALNVVQLFVTGVLVYNLVSPEKGGKSSPGGAAEKEGPDAMNEGFENIMSYSVNGKTGFEREW